MAKHAIKVKKYSDVVEEYVAAGVITPGMLIELTSAGKVQAHSGSSGESLVMVALENELEGQGIDVDYAADDRVQCWIPNRGDMIYGLLADGETAVIGNWLESNGDGKLKVGTTKPIGQAVEAVDMSGSSGEDPTGRIIVRIN